LGGEHSALIETWQREGANVGEELSYAKAAFKNIAANDPGLIAQVEKSGLGNHPSVLRFLAKQGRLDAGMVGDFTVSRNYSNSAPSAPAPVAMSGRGGNAAREELRELLNQNPPGTAAYRTKAVQQRVEALSRAIAGTGAPVGKGGRYA
jgi:hypothetical protein